MPPASPKRVAVVYMLTHPGGVQSCALALIRGLNKEGNVPDVLWDTPPNATLLADAGVEVGFRRIPFTIPQGIIVRLPDTLRYLAWIPNVIRGDQLAGHYDCVFSFYNGILVPRTIPHVYYLSGPPLLPQLQIGPKGSRGIPFRCFQRLYRDFLRRRWPAYEYHRSCHYVINSQYTAGLFHQAHGVHLPVVYPPVDTSSRSFDPADLPKRDTILFFSRIIGYKRPEMVLALAARHREYRCVVMGGVPPNRRSYFETLRAQVQSAGLQVTFLPNPSDQIVRHELARCRFYVFPAINEHFGMTTPEAIASGAIPFVHDSGGQREIVVDERLRFQDPEFFAKFETLSREPAEHLHAIRGALSLHVRTFSEEIFVSKMLAFAGPA